MHTQMHIHTHMYTHTPTHTHKHTHMETHISTHAHKHKHTHTHAKMQTHTHANTHRPYNPGFLMIKAMMIIIGPYKDYSRIQSGMDSFDLVNGHLNLVVGPQLS